MFYLSTKCDASIFPFNRSNTILEHSPQTAIQCHSMHNCAFVMNEYQHHSELTCGRAYITNFIFNRLLSTLVMTGIETRPLTHVPKRSYYLTLRPEIYCFPTCDFSLFRFVGNLYFAYAKQHRRFPQMSTIFQYAKRIGLNSHCSTIAATNP